MGAEKRRSDRVMLTIPLTIHGTDARGHSFKDDARTISLNRHGARIETSEKLRAGQVIRLVNLLGRREAEFRVAGPVSPVTEKGGEWGVEYVDPKENIWGIRFPPPGEEESAASKALLECRTCHTVALLPLSLVEVEVLETSGIISRPCPSCTEATPWGYAEKQVAMAAPPEEVVMMAEAQAQMEARAGDQRRHRRVALQLPVLIRDYYGRGEITKTENISKGGFCFVSEKTYHVGGGAMIICPYDPGSQNIEIKARIVRSKPIEGTNRKIYGVRYDQQSS